jgi:hypothetical protein
MQQNTSTNNGALNQSPSQQQPEQPLQQAPSQNSTVTSGNTPWQAGKQAQTKYQQIYDGHCSIPGNCDCS